MFLDPDPRKQKSSKSGTAAQQSPIVIPTRDGDAGWGRKPIPFSNAAQAEDVQQNPGSSLQKPTVRLVRPTSRLWLDNNAVSTQEGIEDRENVRSVLSPPTDALRPSVLKQGFEKPTLSHTRFQVSDVHKPTTGAHALAKARHDNLISLSNRNASSNPESHRRSGSSGSYSNTSTLREGDSIFGQQSLGEESRSSDATTLRSTPTPSELEQRDKSALEEDASQLSFSILPAVQESSPERSTVRLVSTPPESISENDHSSPESSDTPNNTQPQSSPIVTVEHSTFLDTASQSHTSTDSLPLAIEQTAYSPLTDQYPGQTSAIELEATSIPPSSPNVVAYYSDSSPVRPLYNPSQETASPRSVQPQFQAPTAQRPGSGQSEATDTSWASRPATSDTLPSLYVPKKRLRHKAASASLSAAAGISSISDSTMSSESVDDSVDIYPYPRQVFSTHLSTIASESDTQSRSGSRHLSHFSLGSGVMTGDDSLSIPRSSTWPPQMAEDQVELGSDLSSPRPTINSEPSPGDMTLGVFREQSALPPPLFDIQPPATAVTNQRFHAPLPPLPPPHLRSPDSEEDFDTVPELAPPNQLREQRSGYSLRRRSHSTPSGSHSRQESHASMSSRWSQGTNYFPTWAKAYYAYGATLLSSSQISLSTPIETQKAQNVHQYYFNRDWSERSTISRFGSDRSDIESSSPGASRFLPSIFRPRARKSGATNKWRLGNKPSPPRPGSRSDSMAIGSAPPLRDAEGNFISEPKYGTLKDEPSHPRPLPRRYSRQREWNDMEFPRPMSNDLLNDYDNPRLRPSKRLGQRVSKWRPPSFADSLDTLLRSRCNRQILLFAVGFLCPLFWMIASVLPLPKKPMSISEFEQTQGMASAEDVQVAMMKHEAGDAEKRWREEREWLKARWWRYLNRIMSIIGVLVIAAVIALAVVATKK